MSELGVSLDGSEGAVETSAPGAALPRAPRFAFEWVLVWIAAAAFYLCSVCPTIGFGDTALLIDAMLRANINSHVNNHPLTVALGWLCTALPFGNPAFRANLLSVIFGAATVANLFICFRMYGAQVSVAAAVAAVAAASHSLWWHSTIVENYAVTAALVSLCYLLLTHFDQRGAARSLVMASFFAALSVFNHVQNGFLCLAVGVVGVVAWMRGQVRFATIVGCAVAAIAGLSPWVLLVLKDAGHGRGVADALNQAFFGKFQDTFFSEPFARAIYEVAYLLWWQSPLGIMSVGALLGVVQCIRVRGFRPTLVGMLTHIGLTIGVFAGYSTWDRFAFMLAGFVGLFYFAGVGLAGAAGAARSGVVRSCVVVWCSLSVVVGAGLYAAVVPLARDPLSVWSRRYSGAYSAHLYDQAEYIANPNKRGYVEVERFAHDLFATLPEGATFLDDDSRTYYPLADYFQRHLGLRKDLSILLVNSWGFSDWGLSNDDLSRVVERAYQLNKPFYVAATGAPYASFFEHIKKRIAVEFEQVSIGQGRWVYKLKTSEDTSRRAVMEKLLAQGDVQVVPVVGAAGEVDLGPRSVLYSSSGGVVLQPMKSFGPEWLLDDHLFFSGGGPGIEVEFVVRSETVRVVEAALQMTTASDYGDVRIAVNGAVVTPQPVSLYSPAVHRLKVPLGRISISPEGTAISVRVVDKSPRSSGYRLGIDSFTFGNYSP